MFQGRRAELPWAVHALKISLGAGSAFCRCEMGWFMDFHLLPASETSCHLAQKSTTTQLHVVMRHPWGQTSHPAIPLSLCCTGAQPGASWSQKGPKGEQDWLFPTQEQRATHTTAGCRATAPRSVCESLAHGSYRCWQPVPS